MVSKLCDHVRSLELRPLESTKSWKKVAAESNARQASGIGPTDTRVEAIACRGSIQITRQCGLIQTAVTKTRFIYPARAGGPTQVTPTTLKRGGVVGRHLRL